MRVAVIVLLYGFFHFVLGACVCVCVTTTAPAAAAAAVAVAYRRPRIALITANGLCARVPTYAYLVSCVTLIRVRRRRPRERTKRPPDGVRCGAVCTRRAVSEDRIAAIPRRAGTAREVVRV